MFQPARRRRSVCAVFVSGALVAALLAVGSSSAAAATATPDHATSMTACVGDATEDRMFPDVSERHFFRAAINCLAYYGVTIGYEDGTFKPDDDIARAEMVLFMQRAAGIAGVSDASTVVGDFATTGSDPVNRADMALLIARLLAAATTSDSPVNVATARDGTFTVGGSTPDDFFTDVRYGPYNRVTDSAASALYELGVAQGTGGGAFSPEAPVTRGAMAAFITRALAHTTARPAGVSIQLYLPGEVIVSVRNAAYAPVPSARLDIFSIASSQTGRAFRSDGSCSSQVVATGGRACDIDVLDPVSGPDGDFTFALALTDEPHVTVWAWTGDLGATIRNGDDRLARAEVSTLGVEATDAKVSTDLPEGATYARFGSTVTVTVQLVGINGLRAVPPAAGASYSIRREQFQSIDAPADEFGTLRLRTTEVFEVDSFGKIEFTLTGADPDLADAGDIAADEVLWRYTVTAVGKSPPLTTAVNNVELRFTDAASVATSIDLVNQAKYRRAARSGSLPGSNVVVAHVADQFGKPLAGTEVEVTSDSPYSDFPDTFVATNSNGTARIPYTHTGTSGSIENLTASFAGVNNSPTATSKMIWASEPGVGLEVTTSGGHYEVIASNIQRDEVVVDLDAGGGRPRVLVYDSNDRFRVDGVVVTLGLFESILANEQDDDSGRIFLFGWASRDPNNPRDRTDWYLLT